mmetsp:Transcript_508/g.1090  ORF Transcript_508/g.1090 Transcript_508/m.1090 type:complete len:88 (+) Transcript_508:22-285(+)
MDMNHLGSIKDMNLDNADELELLHTTFEMATMIWRVREISIEQRMRSKLTRNHRKGWNHLQSALVSESDSQIQQTEEITESSAGARI